jgi:hypothetical protein
MTYIVVPASQGGVPPSLPGLTPILDGSTPGVGQVGEILTANTGALTNTGVGATGTWGSAVSLALQPGVYEMFGNAIVAENGAVLTDSVAVGISDSATGVGMDTFGFSQISPFLVGQPLYLLTPVKRVSIAVPTTYYLNTRFNYTSGNPQHAGILWALRYS